MAHATQGCLDVRERICEPHRASLDRRGDIKKRNANSAALPDIAADLAPQGSGKFWRADVVFRGRRRRFGVSQNLALRIDNRGPRACGLPLLRHNILEVICAVGVNPVREHYRFLTQIALYYLAKRSFPRAANGKVKGCSSRGNNEHEGSQQLEENPIPHFGASKRYPAPRTVLRYRGFSGSGSIFS